MAEDRNNAVVVIPATGARQVALVGGFGEKQGAVVVALFSVWLVRSFFSLVVFLLVFVGQWTFGYWIAPCRVNMAGHEFSRVPCILSRPSPSFVNFVEARCDGVPAINGGRRGVVRRGKEFGDAVLPLCRLTPADTEGASSLLRHNWHVAQLSNHQGANIMCNPPASQHRSIASRLRLSG